MPEKREQDRDDRHQRRLRRQFAAMERAAPSSGGTIRALLGPGRRLLRVPVALALIAGGLLAFLPVLGLWMIPLGLLLLAVDVKPLRPPISAAVVRMRAWWRGRSRRRRE